MFAPSSQSYRIAVLGLPSVGKTTLIQKMCSFFSDSVQPTTEETQYTAIWRNDFVFFWDFPAQVVTKENSQDLIVNFGALLYLFDVSNPASYEDARKYLEDCVRDKELAKLPFLLVGMKYDLFPPDSDLNAAAVIKQMTLNLRKTQCVLVSIPNDTGDREIEEWILSRAIKCLKS